MSETDTKYINWIVKQQKAELDYLYELLRKNNIPYTKHDYSLEKFNLENSKNNNKNAGQIINTAQAFNASQVKNAIKSIIKEEITVDHAKLFYSYFKGRPDVFAKRSGKPNPRTGITAYYSQCDNFYEQNICPRVYKKNIPCRDCENQKYTRLTPGHLVRHLKGEESDCSDVVGLYPIFKDNSCNFLVFDFDNHDVGNNLDDYANVDNKWIEEVNCMWKICKSLDIDILVERSRSGRGAHIWIFFDKPIKASVARSFGSAIITKGLEYANLKSFDYYDRMIPNQDELPRNKKSGKIGLGNLIALPLQGRALLNGNSAFIDENWIPYTDQWAKLKSIKKLDTVWVKQKIHEWSNNGLLGQFCDANDYEKSNSNTNTIFNKRLRAKPMLKFNKDDVDGKLHILLADKTYVSTHNLVNRIQNQIRRMASFGNPKFYKNKSLGYSNYNVSRIISSAYDEDGCICLPRALCEQIINKCKDSNIQVNLEDKRNQGNHINVSFQGKLYEEQQEAVDALLAHDIGICAATTSFGKTVVGAYLIAKKQINTLILVHNKEIMKNWLEDLGTFLEIDEELPEYTTKSGRKYKRKSIIGKRVGSHNSMTKIVDVAMFSSLGKKDDIDPIINDYGMIIMDECHHGAATTVEDVIGEASAKYVYGLTATPKRDDGLERKVYMQFGPIRYRYTAKQRAAKQGIDHFVYPRFTRLVAERSNHLPINEAYKLVRNSKIRNSQIIEDVKACIADKRSPLVLSRYRDHSTKLYEMLKNEADNVFLLQGGGSVKEKDELRHKIRNVPKDETCILVATDKYIGEGFNFPRLDTLMLTTPVAWEGNIEQYAGRLHRDYETKKDVIIYDYVDSNIGVFDRMYNKRMSAYKKIGYEICTSLDTNSDNKNLSNAIFDSSNYNKVFKKDLELANKKIVIVSPWIGRYVVDRFINFSKVLLENGVKVTVATLDVSAYSNEYQKNASKLIDKLKSAAIYVRVFESLHHHFVIIDDKIVWYGSMNFLSRIKDDDSVMRIIDDEVVQELMEAVFKI